MGSRKRQASEVRAAAKRTTYSAMLRNCPTSPRKMRLVADMVRGMNVARALSVLEYSSKEASARMEKLLKSAIASYEQKSEQKADENLYIKAVWVDGARTLKRINPAPQGRAHRIRKRSNHITLVLGTKAEIEKATAEN